MENANKKILISLFVLGLIAFFSGIGAMLVFKETFGDLGNVLGQESFKQIQEVPIETNKYLVIRVIDGDTIEVLIDGSNKKIRMIGIDTPELKSKDCFALDAKIRLTDLIDGKEISLISDPTQDDKDKYGRLLRYVYLDGLDINREMIRRGFAKEYTYNKAYINQVEYRNLQLEASIGDLGMWKDCK